MLHDRIISRKMCKLVYLVRVNTDGQRYEEKRDQRQCPRTGLDRPANHHAPCTARKVLKHQYAEAAEADAAPENKAYQPRTQCLLGIEITADRPDDECNSADA